jgi:diguanylate cyclase (GGDEF)-like protein
MDWFDRIFDGSLMPHGQCLLWRSDLLFLHVAGDIFTTVAYAIIPLSLIYLVRSRTDMAFNWIFDMFAAFIFLCGITHLLAIVNIWHGYYFIQGVAKLTTGVISLVTAYMAWQLLPKAIALPSNEMLRVKNAQLVDAQQKLIQANQHLEERVQARTHELEQLAQTDSLTGILNRGGLMQHLAVEINRSLRYKHHLSILMIDLDHFKRVNDEYGHQTGDKVLTESVDILNRLCRRSDCVGRYGGEEFLVLLPETPAAMAAELAERIRLEIAQHRFAADMALNITLTCSIGVTEFDVEQNEYSFLKHVDSLLYRAKRAGRNCVVLAEGNESTDATLLKSG